jgi:hypothetical protein
MQNELLVISNLTWLKQTNNKKKKYIQSGQPVWLNEGTHIKTIVNSWPGSSENTRNCLFFFCLAPFAYVPLVWHSEPSILILIPVYECAVALCTKPKALLVIMTWLDACTQANRRVVIFFACAGPLAHMPLVRHSETSNFTSLELYASVIRQESSRLLGEWETPRRN